ncbi:MAG TPA: helix-turn-helix transcriptional regulator [Dermatophilaceae bacterium]|nr:helix-turn-helix transcriptional regulator [Dermatophilaceae bacterium]
MTVHFRNVDVDPSAPLDTWPFEAIVTMIERGTASDWVRLTRAIRSDPWGPIARQVEDYLGYERPYGVAPLLERAIQRARAQAERRERAAVAAEVAALVARSGLTLTEIASRIGTSGSRLSTYRSGTVMPSAGLLVRLRETVARLGD